MKKIVLFVLAIFLTKISKASDTLVYNNSLSVFFGNRNISQKQVVKNTQRRDYLKSLDGVSDNPFYQQLGFEYKRKITNTNFLTFSLTCYSDLIPRNYELSYVKTIGKYLGFNAGFSKYDLTINEKKSLSFNADLSDFYLGQNELYFEFTNYNFFTGPYFKFNHRYISTEAKLNLGIGGVGKHLDEYNLIKNNSFETNKIEYRFKQSAYMFIQPELNISLFPASFKRSKIGFQARLAYQNSKRAINYERTKYVWTADNPLLEYINGNDYMIKKVEFDFGLIWRN
jgi:hypothetical protein